MDSLSIICIVLGTLTIISRGPLIFASSATLRSYDRLIISTNTWFRAFGVVIATLAMALLFLSFGERALAGFFRAVGWVVATMALLMLIALNVSRRFLSTMFNYLENSVDDVIVRILYFFRCGRPVSLRPEMPRRLMAGPLRTRARSET